VGLRAGLAQTVPRSPRSAYHCAARCSGAAQRHPSGDGDVGASRLARKHVSFRRLQKLDSGRHGAAAAGEQSPVAAASRASSLVARPRVSAGGGESRARSGRCQPARRTTGRRVFLDVSNHGGGSIEVVWRRARPNCVLPTQHAEQVTWFVLSPVCSARGRLSRATRPLSQGSAERARHARCSAKGPKPVPARTPQLGRVVSHQLAAAVTATSTSFRSERARGEVRVVRVCPRILRKGSACDLCGQPSPHATRARADPKSPQ